MTEKIKQYIIRIYERFIKLKGAPREIALGFALGLMVGMSPFFGMHIIIAVMLASLLGWSKIAAAIAVNITNVATAPLIYPITYLVGSKITGLGHHVQWPEAISFSAFKLLLKKSPIIIVDLCVGGLILGIPIAIVGYYLSFRAITLYRERIKKRLKEAKRLRRKKKKNSKGRSNKQK